MSLTLAISAAFAVVGGAALFFFRQWILEKERRRNDRDLIKKLQAMLEHRDRLRDPDAVERVFDAFKPRDAAVRPAAGDDDDDGR